MFVWFLVTRRSTQFWTVTARSVVLNRSCAKASYLFEVEALPGRISCKKVSLIIISVIRAHTDKSLRSFSFVFIFSSSRRQMTCWWRLPSVRAMTKISSRVSRAQVG